MEYWDICNRDGEAIGRVLPKGGVFREGRPELFHLARCNREDGSHMIWDVFLIKKDVDIQELILDPGEVEEVRWVTSQELERMVLEHEVFPYPEMLKHMHMIERLV